MSEDPKVVVRITMMDRDGEMNVSTIHTTQSKAAGVEASALGKPGVIGVSVTPE